MVSGILKPPLYAALWNCSFYITFHNSSLPVLSAALLCSAGALTVFVSESGLPLGYTGGNGEEDQNVLLQRSRHCHEAYRNMIGDWSVIHLLSWKGAYGTIILSFFEVLSRPNTLAIIMQKRFML